ncbi:MAG TPA: hypothetical protein VGC77_10405 [Rhodopseudomonas sp.]|uniref:hypothetical protein n=1 Tax=Rhodopseudomonas sp. TaxID=1078 RepID=UPI002ED9B504
MADQQPSDLLVKQAELTYQSIIELRKSAYSSQAEYGRWMINTLWLMHSGAIVGLLFKAHAGEHPPAYAGSLFWFVAGIVFAFIAAASAFWNFTFAAQLFHSWADARMLSNLDAWPKRVKTLRFVITLWISMTGGLLSLSCLVLGSISVLHNWN